MANSTSNRLFFVAALFNGIVGLLLFFAPNLFLTVFQVTPAVSNTLWVQLFAILVLAFGLGYYWAAQNVAANAAVVKLGIIAKTGVVLVIVLNIITGAVSWQLLVPASADAVFALLFWRALPIERSNTGARDLPS